MITADPFWSGGAPFHLTRCETMALTDEPEAIAQLPKRWQGEVRRELDPGETVLAWFEPDLDTQLRYASGLVLVTDRRVLTTQGGGGAGVGWHS